MKIKPQDLLKAVKYNHIAMDKDGKWCAYVNKPELLKNSWNYTHKYIKINGGKFENNFVR